MASPRQGFLDLRPIKASQENPIGSTVYTDRLGSEMVTIYVGPKSHKFVAHKKLLCQQVPYFKKMFEGNFKEAHQSEAFFPEDHPASFDLLLEDVYNLRSRKLRDLVLNEDKKGNKVASWDPVSFYSLAEKLCLPALQDRIMTATANHHRATCELPSLDFVRRAYTISQPGSGLQRYCVAALARVSLWNDRSYNGLEDFPEEQVFALTQEFPNLLKDLLQYLRHNEPIDPRDAAMCHFHEHEMGDLCPVTGKRSRAPDENSPEAKKIRTIKGKSG